MTSKPLLTFGQGARWGAGLGILAVILRMTRDFLYHPFDSFMDMSPGNSFFITLLIVLPFAAVGGAVIGLFVAGVMQAIRRKPRKEEN